MLVSIKKVSDVTPSVMGCVKADMEFLKTIATFRKNDRITWVPLWHLNCYKEVRRDMMLSATKDSF